MITLFELAEYNAAKKNYTRRIDKTHKDVIAFLCFADWFYIDRLMRGNITEYPQGLYS